MEQITLLLDNVRSAYNVGAIMRAAAAFGVRDIIHIGVTPHPLLKQDQRLPHVANRAHREIAKTALGAETSLRSVYFTDFKTFQATNNLPIVALEQRAGSVNLPGFKPALPLVMAIGSEVDGVANAIINASTAVVEIPHTTGKESLNVATATAVALYDFYTKLETF